MVGEIRDFATLDLAFKAALTGHLVLATLHTNDAKTSIYRLLNMGLNLHEITSSLLLVFSQALVARICTSCAGEGCFECNFSGILGREVISEALKLDLDTKLAIKNNALEEHLKATNFEDIYKNASLKISEGKIHKSVLLGL